MILNGMEAGPIDNKVFAKDPKKHKGLGHLTQAAGTLSSPLPLQTVKQKQARFTLCVWWD